MRAASARSSPSVSAVPGWKPDSATNVSAKAVAPRPAAGDGDLVAAGGSRVGAVAAERCGSSVRIAAARSAAGSAALAARARKCLRCESRASARSASGSRRRSDMKPRWRHRPATGRLWRQDGGSTCRALVGGATANGRCRASRPLPTVTTASADHGPARRVPHRSTGRTGPSSGKRVIRARRRAAFVRSYERSAGSLFSTLIRFHSSAFGTVLICRPPLQRSSRGRARAASIALSRSAATFCRRPFSPWRGLVNRPRRVHHGEVDQVAAHYCVVAPAAELASSLLAAMSSGVSEDADRRSAAPGTAGRAPFADDLELDVDAFGRSSVRMPYWSARTRAKPRAARPGGRSPARRRPGSRSRSGAYLGVGHEEVDVDDSRYSP